MSGGLGDETLIIQLASFRSLLQGISSSLKMKNTEMQKTILLWQNPAGELKNP